MRDVFEVGERIRFEVDGVVVVGEVAGDYLRTSEGVPVVVPVGVWSVEVPASRPAPRWAAGSVLHVPWCSFGGFERLDVEGFAPSWFFGGPLPELGTVFVCGRRSR